MLKCYRLIKKAIPFCGNSHKILRKSTQIFEEIPNFFVQESVNFAGTDRSLKGCHCISGDCDKYFLGKSAINFEEKSKGFWG